jgi:hypothetical protein
VVLIYRVSRHHFLSEDESTEIFIKPCGSRVNDKKMGSGAWRFSSRHGDMMPHQPAYSIFVNGDRRADDLFEEDVERALLSLGFKVTR